MKAAIFSTENTMENKESHEQDFTFQNGAELLIWLHVHTPMCISATFARTTFAHTMFKLMATQLPY